MNPQNVREKSRKSPNNVTEDQIVSNVSQEEKDNIIQFLSNPQVKECLDLSQNDINTATISAVPGGSVNVNYKASFDCTTPNSHTVQKTYFIKKQISTSETYKDSLAREYSVLQALNNINLNVPSPIYYSHEKNMLITQYIEGAKITQNRKNPQLLKKIGIYLNDLRTAPIEVMKRVHTGKRLSPRIFWLRDVKPKILCFECDLLPEGSNYLFDFLNEIIQSLDLALRTEPRESDFTWDAYEASTEPDQFGWFTLLHNDFAFRNLLLSKNEQVFAVDWEFADSGDIAFDIASLITEDIIDDTELESILNGLHVSPKLRKHIKDNVKRFKPVLELHNTYWTINYIQKRVSGDLVNLRAPNTLTENIHYVKYRLKSLTDQFRLKQTYPVLDAIFLELQTALKLFQGNILWKSHEG